MIDTIVTPETILCFIEVSSCHSIRPDRGCALAIIRMNGVQPAPSFDFHFALTRIGTPEWYVFLNKAISGRCPGNLSSGLYQRVKAFLTLTEILLCIVEHPASRDVSPHNSYIDPGVALRIYLSDFILLGALQVHLNLHSSPSWIAQPTLTEKCQHHCYCYRMENFHVPAFASISRSIIVQYK